MKKFYCDYCKLKIEQANYDYQVVEMKITAVANYQHTNSASVWIFSPDEYHFHKDCFKRIAKIINPEDATSI